MRASEREDALRKARSLSKCTTTNERRLRHRNEASTKGQSPSFELSSTNIRTNRVLYGANNTTGTTTTQTTCVKELSTLRYILSKQKQNQTLPSQTRTTICGTTKNTKVLLRRLSNRNEETSQVPRLPNDGPTPRQNTQDL